MEEISQGGVMAKPRGKKDLWKPEEDLLLRKYVEAHGEGNWATVSQRSGLMRGGKSCRLRWKNYLRPDIKRGGMSKQEEDLIIRMHRLLGNRWSLIAGRLPGRTDNEVKNYWNTHLKKGRSRGKRKPPAAVDDDDDDTVGNKRRRRGLSDFQALSDGRSKEEEEECPRSRDDNSNSNSRMEDINSFFNHEMDSSSMLPSTDHEEDAKAFLCLGADPSISFSDPLFLFQTFEDMEMEWL